MDRPDRIDPRLKGAAILALIAALYTVIQHTSYAPFPHAADGFVAGFGVGIAIAGVIAWFRTRS